MEINEVAKVTGTTIALIGLLGKIGAGLRKFSRRRAVYDWLASNTTEEAGNTHRSFEQISVGTRLPVDDVLVVCRRDKRILQASNQPELWGIWRKEPQSIYETRGLLVIG